MKTVVVIDGQSGRVGQLFIERIKSKNLLCKVVAIGTNAIATSNMLKAGAHAAGTGENPVVVACRSADIIAEPIGILVNGRDYTSYGFGSWTISGNQTAFPCKSLQ